MLPVLLRPPTLGLVTIAYATVLASGCVPDVSTEVADSAFTSAVPGSLDTSFGGGDGYVNISSPAAGPGTYDVGTGIAIDSAGRILIVGESYDGASYRSFICRLDTSGNLDGTFGTSGCSNTVSTAGGGFNDGAYAVTVDSADRPVVVGVSRDGGFTQENMTVWRYDTAGALDIGAFGSGTGYFTSTNAAGGGINRDGAGAVALGAGDTIFTSGSSRGAGGIEMAVWGINASGTAFLGGFPQTNLPSGAGQHGGGGLIQHSSGNILVAGYSTPAVNGSQALWNYATDGTLQGGSAGFDTIGWPSAGGGPIVEDSGMTVIVAGNATDTGTTPATNYLALWRYTLGAPPTLTSGFGFGAGNAYYAISLVGHDYDAPQSIARDALGRIVVSGFSYQTVDRAGALPDHTAYLAVWRFTSDGNYDTTFGDGTGFVTFPSAVGATLYPFDQGKALRIDSSGRYVIGGISRDNSGNQHIAVWRVNP